VDDMSFNSFLSFAGLSAILALAMFGCSSTNEPDASPAAGDDAAADVSLEADDAGEASAADAGEDADEVDAADAAAE